MSQPVAVISGGAQGIGRRTAEVLSERGYDIAIIDLQRPVATIRAVEAVGRAVLAQSGDIGDELVVATFGRAVFERFGRIDVLVNNAGLSHIAPAEDTAF